MASMRYFCRDCEIKTRLEEEGKDVEVCDPKSKTVCVAKTRYEPEEYLGEDCTTTTEEVCKTNYVRLEISKYLLSSFECSGHQGGEVHCERMQHNLSKGVHPQERECWGDNEDGAAVHLRRMHNGARGREVQRVRRLQESPEAKMPHRTNQEDKVRVREGTLQNN